MVYKIFQSARSTSQSAVKALSHNGGTLFAASQSGYAAANNPLNALSQNRRQRSNTKLETHKHFSTQVSSGSIAERVASSTAGDAHLESYLNAWRKNIAGEREWNQFQFPKTIGYHATEEGSKASAKEEGRPKPSRIQSSSAVEDVKRAEAAAYEAVAVESVNKDIAATIAKLHRAELSRVAAQEVEAAEGNVEAFDNISSVVDSATVSSATPPKSLATEITSSPVSSPESEAFADRLDQLREIGRYAEIPAVFESMLRQGLVPTPAAYNALIAAAYHLPALRYQVVPKVLDVYSDMLKRGVMPNKATYTLMLEIMAVRALEVLGMKRGLAEKKLRYAAFQDADKFLFPAEEIELEVQADSDILTLAAKIFKAAAAGPEGFVFAAETYRVLLQAYADSGDVDQMLRVFAHMEQGGVVPIASTFSPMVRAFAKSGDLPSAVECYNEYKNLAIEDNSGKFSLVGRADNDMYAAVVEGYLQCDNEQGATKFFRKLVGSLEAGSESVQEVRNAVTLQALVKSKVGNKQYTEAFDAVTEQGLTGTTRDAALKEICESAADRGQVEAATQAFDAMGSEMQQSSGAAMLVMHVRNNEMDLARRIWSIVTSQPQLGSSLIAPGVLYVSALTQQGSAMEGMAQMRHLFDQIRAREPTAAIAERMDASFAFIGMNLARKGIVLSGPATMSFMHAMIENRGPVPQLTEQLFAGIGPEAVNELNSQDLELALQLQSDILRSKPVFDAAHGARFAHMVETALGKAIMMSPRTVEAVDAAMPTVAAERADLVSRWGSRNAQVGLGISSPVFAAPAPPPVTDGFDPYASNMDHRGSVAIVDELDKQGPRFGNSLNEAMNRLRNIRRAGRHPRYIAYAKLIGIAARDNKTSLMKDVFGMAQQDMPLQPEYAVVRHGWVSILDAMVAGCLTTGNRTEAFHYHQQLLDIGAAPSANTFGLYITTLKESTKTFDEATEAVRIFKRAQAEGVEPSSFLYNALIGKLGKARRIDDCLFYFSEMRQLGIRPTSVTYGTIVNALCRVSDERFAVELFDEMESMPNYKPRPAPYNSMMQFFLTTKRDSAKVLEYYNRMLARKIQPTMHTYKLLIDTYATLEPVNLPAAEGVLDLIRSTGQKPEPVHFSSLIHAKGCALHDMAGARALFDKVLADRSVNAHSCLYQALFESMTANHVPMLETQSLLADMQSRRVDMTPYIANTLIHGWAGEGKLAEARKIYNDIGMTKREPSTYEAMTKAYLSVQDTESARQVVREMLSRGYPAAVSGKVLDLLGHATAPAPGHAPVSAEVTPVTPVVASTA